MKNRSKADDWRLVANIIWLMGVGLTANFILSGWEKLLWWHYGVIIALCFPVQYAFSKVESILLSGAIPPPWNKDADTRTNWIWFGLCVMLGIDALVNIGGVGVIAKFFLKSDTGDILRSDFGTSDSGLEIIKGIVILALALFVVVAPELLRLYADIIEREDSKFVEVKTVLTPEINNDIINAKKKAQRTDEKDIHRTERVQTPTNRFEPPSIRRSNNGTDRTGQSNRKEVNPRDRYRTGKRTD